MQHFSSYFKMLEMVLYLDYTSFLAKPSKIRS